LRTAEVGGRLYIDLGNDRREVVEVDADGWRVIDARPDGVRFRLAPGMRALPTPQPGGRIELLREFVNLKPAKPGEPDDFVLFVAWLLDAFRSGKHPILNPIGEHGTAKSTLARVAKRLVDPDDTNLRSLPETTRDMFIAVNHARVRAWDNISRIDRKISDALCQLSDGSGFGIRRLHTDDDEYRVQGSRAVLITSLTNCVTRPDCASRTITLTLKPIPETARKSEAELWARFNTAYPLILGALFDALAHGLKQLPSVRLDRKARMADFQIWGHACEGAYAAEGSFARAFAANAVEVNEAVIETDSVAIAILAFMMGRTTPEKWTAARLLTRLTDHDTTEQQVSEQSDWPKDATRFSGRLRAISASLRKAGVAVEFGKAKDRNKTRQITLRNVGRSDAADARAFID
jgi:hypothetical protein